MTVAKNPKDDYIIIAIDSTGIKVTNRGQWLRDKWNIRKRVFENSRCSRHQRARKFFH